MLPNDIIISKGGFCCFGYQQDRQDWRENRARGNGGIDIILQLIKEKLGGVI